MANSTNDMDVCVDDDGEVFVTKNAAPLLRQHRIQQQPGFLGRNSTGVNTPSHASSLYSVALERVYGLTLTSNAAFSSFADDNLVAYPAGFIVVIYSLHDNRQSFITNPVKRAFTCLAFSHDGRFLVTGEAGASACVRIWSVRDRAQLVELSGGHKQSIKCVAFSPRNTKYAVSVGGPQDNYIRVWQWRSALAPSYNNSKQSEGDNSRASAPSHSAALIASNKFSSPVNSLTLLTLPSRTSHSGDTASSTGHSANDDAMIPGDDDEENNDDAESSTVNKKRTNILIVTAGASHLKFWSLDAALQGRGKQQLAMRREAKARQSTMSKSSAASSNILPGRSVKLDEIEFFNDDEHRPSDFIFGDVATASFQPDYVICCVQSPIAALLQFHTQSRRLEKWVELKAAHAYCLAIAPYPFPAETADATDAAIMHRHENFDHYQKYEVVFVGCSQGIIRVFDCDTLNVVVSSLPRPHWLGVPAQEANLKGRPAQPPNLSARDIRSNSEIILPPSIVYPDCIALRYDAQHHHLAAVYSDHSLYVWDVRRLLVEKRIGKLTNALAHSRCIWGLDSIIMPSIFNNNSSMQQESADNNNNNNNTTLLVSCGSDNTVRLWSLPSAAGSHQSSKSSRPNQQSVLSHADSSANTAHCELEAIIYNTNTVSADAAHEYSLTFRSIDGRHVDENAADKTTLSIAYLNDAAFDDDNVVHPQTSTQSDANQGCRCVRISDDCRLLAAGYRDGNIRVFELKFDNQARAVNPHAQQQQIPLPRIECNPVCRVEAHESEVLCLEFNTPHDGLSSTMHRRSQQQKPAYLLASGSRDRLIHLFDVRREFAYVTTIDCHTSSITALQFYTSSYTHAVQRQGGVKGGTAMLRRLHAAAKRQKNHQLLMLATCGLDKEIMFTHVDFLDNVEPGDEQQFEQIDAITTPCAMYDMRLVRGKAVASRHTDSSFPAQDLSMRQRRPTPAEPYGELQTGVSSSTSSMSSPIGGRRELAAAAAVHSRMQQQYDRIATGEFDDEGDAASSAPPPLAELYTANQDQFVRVYDAIGRKWVRSFCIETQQRHEPAKKNAAAGAVKPASAAAIIKIDISHALLHENTSHAQQQLRQLIAVSCSDKTLALYDAISGEPACAVPFYGHSELVTSLKLIDSGRRLVSAAGDSTMFVWRITPPVPAVSDNKFHTLQTNSATAGGRRRRSGTIVSNLEVSVPTHAHSVQNLTMQAKLLSPANTPGSRYSHGKSGLPPAPMRAKLRDSTTTNQQRQFSDESDDDRKSSSMYSLRNNNTMGQQQQRRRSAAPRAGTLNNRRSSIERQQAGIINNNISGSGDDPVVPRWAPPASRRRLAHSVERPIGENSQQQQLRLALAAVASQKNRNSPAYYRR